MDRRHNREMGWKIVFFFFEEVEGWAITKTHSCTAKTAETNCGSGAMEKINRANALFYSGPVL